MSFNRIKIYLGDSDQSRVRHDHADGDDAWRAWAERTANQLKRDADAVDAGEMSVEEFDEKW